MFAKEYRFEHTDEYEAMYLALAAVNQSVVIKHWNDPVISREAAEVEELLRSKTVIPRTKLIDLLTQQCYNLKRR